MRLTEFQYQEILSRQGRPPRPAPKDIRERDIHDDIIEYCNSRFPRWKFIHSRTDKRTRCAIGAPDFVVFLPRHRFLVLEVKRVGGKPTPEQRNFAAEMAKLGTTVHFVESVREFLLAAESEMNVGQPVSNLPPA